MLGVSVSPIDCFVAVGAGDKDEGESPGLPSVDFLDCLSSSEVDTDGWTLPALFSWKNCSRDGGEEDNGGGADLRWGRRGGRGGLSSLVHRSCGVRSCVEGISSEWIRCRGGIDF